ncbi:hypothetical protein MPSEU_000850800 [Mayamaea pseudoterrestris]|nr:hypothetical protein MPSEU_000850800 [Mayamaea pseudoterrestris]
MSQDDSYYPYGRVNPNTKHPMYWHDASNILQDLDQFSELYVQFHSCAWSPLDFNEQQQEQGENMDENDYWYMNAMPQSGPNIAFSLYGSLKKGRNFSGCNKRTYINSFYTTAGFSVFADTLASAGISNAGTEYSATCSNNAQLACHDNSKSSSFVLLNYNGDCGSSRVKSKTIPSELAAFNSMLANEAQCAKIYSSSDSAAPTLLQYSRSCSLNDFVGACPDPYGRRSAIERGFFELTTLTTYYEQSMQGFLLLGAGAVVWISAGALVYFEYHKTRGSNKNTVFELPRLGRIKKENGSDDGTMSASSSDDSRRNVDDAYQCMDADANDDTSANSDGYEIIKEPLSDAVSIKSRVSVKSRDDPINHHTVENAEPQAGQRLRASGKSLPRNKCVNQQPWTEKILNAAAMDLTHTDVASVLTHSEKVLSLKCDSDECADGTIEMLLRREVDMSTSDAARGNVPLANLYGIHQSCSEHDSSSSYSSSSSKSNDDWSEVSEPVCEESLCAEDASSVSSLATSTRTPNRPDLKSDSWYKSTGAIQTSLAIVNVSASYVSGVIGRVLLQTEPEVAAEETIINSHDADRSMDQVALSDNETSMVVAHNPSDESSRNVMEGVRTSRSESSTSTHISIDSGDGVCICSPASAGNFTSGAGKNGVDKLVCRKVSADIGSPARLILTADSSGDMTNRTTAAMPEPSPLERSIRLVNGHAGSIMLQFTLMNDTVETAIAESRALVDLDAGQTSTELNEAEISSSSARIECESLRCGRDSSNCRTSTW